MTPPSPHQRRVEIASILAKYGWDVLLFRLALVEMLPSGLRQRFQMSSFLAVRQLEEDPGAELILPLPSVLRAILEELGPTYVKLGQVLSTRADLLPQPYIDELAKLQEQVTPAPWADMEQVILEEWNARPGAPAARSVLDIYSDFDTIPLAAGSLGQVYKAKIRTESGLTDVIVKVQRPGIDVMVEADMAVLLDFARLITARTQWGKWNNVIGLAEEFAQVLRNELDFTKEALNTEEIGKNLAAWYGDKVKTSHIYWDYTSRRMQVQEFLQGAKVSALFPRRDGQGPPLIDLAVEQRKRIAETLTVCFLRQIFVDGLFHADPHPGNVMFQFKRGADSMPTLVLIDFGMVGRTDPRSREILIDFFLAMIQFDAVRATDRILEYGHPQQRVDKFALTAELDHVLREFLGKPTAEVQMGKLLQRVMDLMLKYRVRMPTSFLLISRVLVTTEGICRQLDPDYMLIKVAEPFIRSLIQSQFTSLLQGEQIMRIALDVKNFMLRTPRRIDDFLTQLTSGQIRIETDFRNLQRIERTLTVVGNKIAFSLLNAALLLAGALMMHLEHGPRLFGFPAVSVVTFSLSAALGIWLLVSILRSGQLK
ncbi:MAG: AarF/ABC1/UbiB kinase family protein [Candidatus Sericytochromatia bacterium]|uniref:AarF/ABC1/UbiB kinase family protein n=1 Tax=Candidatus Tanganyikabacteria bacterium TaxID=2961651 RepID=A0A938BMK9_9BACT|nr:AarF/ABC1/UbiB kinase family protein [Candidatus Tanganyikabacteria bacterium]